MFVTWILLCQLLTIVSECYGEITSRQCRTLDPPSVPQLQAERLRGPWFAQFFKAGRTLPIRFKLDPFVQDFIFFGKEIESRISGRRIENPNDCLYETSTQVQFGQTGRFSWTSNVRYRGRILDWRIQEVDFRRGYLIRWACLLYVNGVCDDFEIAIWSRRPVPFRRTVMQRVRRVVKNIFCLEVGTDVPPAKLRDYCPPRPGQIIRLPIVTRQRINVYG